MEDHKKSRKGRRATSSEDEAEEENLTEEQDEEEEAGDAEVRRLIFIFCVLSCQRSVFSCCCVVFID